MADTQVSLLIGCAGQQRPGAHGAQLDDKGRNSKDIDHGSDVKQCF